MIDSFKRHQRRVWSAVASELEDFGDVTIFPIVAQAAGTLLDAVSRAPGPRLLDVACGPGLWLAQAMDWGMSVTAVDLSPVMVARAQRRNPTAAIADADGEDLPFTDSSFDAVTCNFGLPHFPRPQVGIAEAFRVLTPAGRFAFTAHPPALGGFFEIVHEAISACGDPAVRAPSARPTRWLPNSSTRWMARTGFVDVSVETLALTVEVSTPAALLDIAYTTRRHRTLLMSQTPDRRDAIERRIIDAALRSAGGGPIILDLPAVLCAGTRPA